MDFAPKWTTFLTGSLAVVIGCLQLHNFYDLICRGNLLVHEIQDTRFGFPFYRNPEQYGNVLLIDGTLFLCIGLLAFYCYVKDKIWIAKNIWWVIAAVATRITLEICWLAVYS